MIDKQERKRFCLISGSFNAEDARQVLMSLINYKINFHELNAWSHKERFGEDHAASLKRIEELGLTREEIAKLIKEAAARGQKLRISSSIEIELERG